ncbi:hypothetical protein TraAM80_05503 [Trypanosoma rangeli]|uniref:Uncharacterized protein n=1 Tax=Trypanosoma rangeli TaxID=5698 RepID=A0A422NFL6_TRYRA|nr:uncharacterized protein TraAM80_05503 [Trypanosoma rangeli]RNF04236.1 hypothetical protein TraAM80_05503 [Trypanosoma rangeli]|eukprot:RNF04236.1 hypothetical protein TraAM80_05503 [Trypanosoma rangeli]
MKMEKFPRQLQGDEAPLPKASGAVSSPLFSNQREHMMSGRRLQSLPTRTAGGGSLRAGNVVPDGSPSGDRSRRLPSLKEVNPIALWTLPQMLSRDCPAYEDGAQKFPQQVDHGVWSSRKVEESGGSMGDSSSPQMRQAVVFVEGLDRDRAAAESAGNGEQKGWPAEPPPSNAEKQKPIATNPNPMLSVEESRQSCTTDLTPLPLKCLGGTFQSMNREVECSAASLTRCQLNTPPLLSKAAVEKMAGFKLSSFTPWHSENVPSDAEAMRYNLGRNNSNVKHLTSTLDATEGSLARSLINKTASDSVASPLGRPYSGKVAERDGRSDVSISLHAPEREGRNRRLKKDAQSLFSLEIPSFDEKTGSLGSECIFPRSLAVDVAIENVLSQERGELRTKVSGVGIRRFLTEFQESREIIYVYFWYIIAHIRRIHAEKTLIGRYVNLERVVRGAFPRYKADLPPINQLEWILLKGVYSSTQLMHDSATMFQEVVGEVPPFVPAVSNLPPHPGGSITVSDDGVRTSHSPQRRRKSYQRSSRTSMSNSAMEVASEKLLQDPNTIWRCTDAINAFRVIQLEVYELAEFAQRCFHRLAMLFGRAFERLAEEKDDVLAAFMFVVPHVVYYVFVYCFPNDVVAGLFNASMRVNLYRIFYFWCSGLVATYVRVNGWPRPPAAGKGVPLKNIEQYAATPSVSESTLALATLLPPKLSASPSDAREELNCETLPPLLANSSSPPSCVAMSGERVAAVDNDNSFEDVDVEVANGHHRLTLEFRRYAKHVNYLLRELAERTEGMHQELACAATSPPHTETENNFVREAAAVERTGDQYPVAEKRAFFQYATAPLSGGPMMSKLRDSSHFSKMLPSLAPHHRNNIAAATADNVGTKLPAIPPTFSSAKTRKATSTNSDCILSGFPLDRMASHVKQYILHSTGKSVEKVPLPPLDGDLSTEDTRGKELTPSVVDRSPTLLSSRTVKMPLPFTSPFFQYYAGERLCANAKGANKKVTAKVTTHGSSNFFFSPLPLNTAGSSEDSVNSHTAAAPTSLTEPLPLTTTRKPSLPLTHGLSKSNNNNNNNSGNTKSLPLMFPHSTQKVINVMLIPLSNTHLRPLQFKNLTKEVARRQLEMERKMDLLSEREQVLRQQYIAEIQQGTRRVHTLLAECQSDRMEMEAQRGLSNVKMKKGSLKKRRKQTRLEAINR